VNAVTSRVLQRRFLIMAMGKWWRSGVLLAATFMLLVASGCSGGGDRGDEANPDTLSRAQKDSLLSTLPVPGAGAVGKALEASERARARAEQVDTVG
jgi:hypothetical protein